MGKLVCNFLQSHNPFLSELLCNFPASCSSSCAFVVFQKLTEICIFSCCSVKEDKKCTRTPVFTVRVSEKFSNHLPLYTEIWIKKYVSFDVFDFEVHLNNFVCFSDHYQNQQGGSLMCDCTQGSDPAHPQIWHNCLAIEEQIDKPKNFFGYPKNHQKTKKPKYFPKL